MPNVELENQASQSAISIRATIAEKDLATHVPRSFSMILSYLNELGEQPTGVPFCAYYNIDTQNLGGTGLWDVELGFPVSRPLPERGEIKSTRIREGKAVSYTYKGSYSGLGLAYAKITEWIKANAYKPIGISYEYYLNSAGDVPEDELLTKVVMLVE